jgi:hypothetical protein
MFRARYLCHGCKVRMRNVQVQQSLTESRERPSRPCLKGAGGSDHVSDSNLP